MPSIDVKNLSNGSAVFGLDKRLPNLKFAAIKRSPVTFETIESLDKTEASKIKHVLKLAAKKAGYGKQLPEGHTIGLAVHYSFYSHVAVAVEVSVVNDKLKVHNVNLVVDCGMAINRDTIKAQMEGATIFGMSLALYGKITAKDGVIEQSNFHDYQMLRMPDVPKINVEIVDSNDKPTGVGEPGVPVIAPAIVNAIFKATGKGYRTLPLSNHGLI